MKGLHVPCVGGNSCKVVHPTLQAKSGAVSGECPPCSIEYLTYIARNIDISSLSTECTPRACIATTDAKERIIFIANRAQDAVSLTLCTIRLSPTICSNQACLTAMSDIGRVRSGTSILIDLTRTPHRLFICLPSHPPLLRFLEEFSPITR